MYLRWTNNGKGYIWLSKSGLRDFVESRLYQGVVCRDIYFIEDEHQLVVSLVMGEDTFYLDSLRLSEDLTKNLNAMGIDVVVSWDDEDKEKDQKELSFFERPLFWGIASSALSATLTMGFKKTFSCLAIGCFVYGFVFFLNSETGRLLKSYLVNFIKEILD